MKNGFTIIELLIVVSVLGVLSGVVISAVNQKAQKQRAQDAVGRGRLEQLAQGLESYNATEGKYPTQTGTAPTSVPDYAANPHLTDYIVTWPSGYTYVVSADQTAMAVYFQTATGSYLKYSSSFAKIKVCTSASISDPVACTEIL